jgi:molybdate transport system substrate-binding protein
MMTYAGAMIRTATLGVLIAATGFGAAGCGRSNPAAVPPTLVVFAAASTSEVMRDLGLRYQSATGVGVTLSLGSSSTLAKQIEAGAPADVFVSADPKWMDHVESAGFIRRESRRDLLGNRLVMIAPKDQPIYVEPTREFDVAARLTGVKRLAIGDPAHVPAGRYARQALDWLGWWPALENRIIGTPDVRAALRLVEAGEADAGIVYATDAKFSARVVVVAVLPEECHEPIRYPVALTSRASPGAAEFLEFLRTPEAARRLEDAGFTVLGGGR